MSEKFEHQRNQEAVDTASPWHTELQVKPSEKQSDLDKKGAEKGPEQSQAEAATEAEKNKSKENPDAAEVNTELSINGVPRNLNLEEETATFIATRGRKTESKPGEDKPSNDDLIFIPGIGATDTVLSKEEAEDYKKASSLVQKYSDRLEKQVTGPLIKEFAEGLNAMERNLPPEELLQLERGRLNFQASKDAYEKREAEIQESGKLLYLVEPERTKEMKEFDAKARELLNSLGEKGLQQALALEKEFPGLAEARERLRDYEERIERALQEDEVETREA